MMIYEFLQNLLEKFLIELLVFLAGIIVPLLVLFVKQWMAKGKARYPKAWGVFEKAVRFAVAEAEELGLGGLIDDKLGYAVSYVDEYLSSRGWDVVSVKAIMDAIELEVKRQFNFDEILEG